MPPKKTTKAKPEPEPVRATRSKSAAKPTENTARKSKSVPPTESKSRTVKKNVSMTETEDDHKLQFEFGEFFAFIDKADIQNGEQKISIGMVSAQLVFNSISVGEQGSCE